MCMQNLLMKMFLCEKKAKISKAIKFVKRIIYEDDSSEEFREMRFFLIHVLQKGRHLF